MSAAFEERLIEIITTDPERRKILEAVATLDLPDIWVAGGFVRNPVWSAVFPTSKEVSGNDIDVVYYKPLHEYGMPEHELVGKIRNEKTNPVWEEEEKISNTLQSLCPGHEYEVKNQARMYFSAIRSTVPDKPYAASSDAIADWVETATAVGIRQNNSGAYEVLAPYGLDDLFKGIIRPTSQAYEQVARERAARKNWLTHWPELQFAPAV